MSALPAKSPIEFFVTCAPGVEPLLHREVKALGLGRVEQQVGGVRFVGSAPDAWRANLELRTAVRVLRRVTRFEARDASGLEAGVQSIDWTTLLPPGGTLRVDAHSNASALEHTLFVEQRTKDAICDQLRVRTGTRPSVDLDDPTLSVYVHLFHDRCTVLLDTSGESLHKRGWRRFQGRAPLAETLAAAVVLASGWDRRSPLVDPFCGSGTILIEAALLAADMPPGAFRERFAFERWPGHDARAFDALRSAARVRGELPKKLVLRGSDADPEIVRGALENVASAGFEGRVALEVARAEDFAPKKGWNAQIASNVPYGERIGDERDLLPTFERFGRVLQTGCAGWHAAILSGNPRLAAALALPRARHLPFQNGSIACELLLADL